MRRSGADAGLGAIYDSGHAGKHAAEWCGQNFHEFLLDAVLTHPTKPVPDLLNQTFHAVDARISRLSSQDHTHSGCTAVTAFLRLEEGGEDNVSGDEPVRGFVNPGLKSRGLLEGKGIEELEKLTASNRSGSAGGSLTTGGAASYSGDDENNSSGGANVHRKSSGRRIKDFVKGLTGSSSSSNSGKDSSNSPPNELSEQTSNSGATPATATPSDTGSAATGLTIADGSNRVELIEPKSDKGLKRVLYTANVGDARAVLW